MFRAIGRFVVASAAGAGIGALAAIAKERLGGGTVAQPQNWEPAPAVSQPQTWDPAPATTSAPAVPHSSPQYASIDETDALEMAVSGASPVETDVEAVAASPSPATAEHELEDVAAPSEPDPGPEPAADRSAEIADLDAARARLRERAAELRAEMERQVGS